MFEIGIENNIPLNLEYWSINDLPLHWAFETYELIDGYALNFLFTNMIKPKSIEFIRAVRTRNQTLN